MSRLARFLLFASVLLGAESISIHAALQYFFPVPHYDLPQQVLMEGEKPIQPMKAALPRLGAKIPPAERDKWIVHCSSEQEPSRKCKKAIDGSLTTFWQTKTSDEGAQKPDPLAHTITIDLQVNVNVNAISMTPYKGREPGGIVTAHQVYLSLDNETWGDPVAFGTWFRDTEGQTLFQLKIRRGYGCRWNSYL